MLIDYLSERYLFTARGLVLSVIAYAVAALVALLLRRAGQSRGAKKAGTEYPKLPLLLVQDLSSGLWSIFFFVMTGCLKGPLREENRAKTPEGNRKIFWGGICNTAIGAIVSVLLYNVLWIFAENTFVSVLMLFARALVSAHLSLLIFSLLPLPCSDAETFLRKKPFGKKGLALRRQGTFPFLIYTTLSLLLACITLPVWGTSVSVSGLLTLFPLLLIGG